jgi:5-methylcytosine-specific restriction endonuclease McrBC regulatory subunit McrC
MLDNNNKQLIQINEYNNREIEKLDISFTDEEINIIENEYYNKLEIIFKRHGKLIIKTQQYVGYIILPNHIISIIPKIPKISFINMVKYALQIPELKSEEFEISEENNYYDILVLFLFQQLEILIQRGLNTGYKIYEENLNKVKGKILFKENLAINFNRPDKIFCLFSETSQDILENQIIKYVVYHLSQCYFIDESINAKLINYYNQLDSISLVPMSLDIFSTIEYTPLNEHYRTILKLCELLLKDSSIDEENIGEKTAISFLIDMNKLFEKSVVNILRETLPRIDNKYKIYEQKKEYADIQRELELRIDILITYNNKPSMILDTKYMEFDSKPSSSHLAQMNLYSDIKKVKECGLIFPGTNKNIVYSLEPIGLNLHILFFDIQAETQYEFKNKCNLFVNSLIEIINSFRVRD